MSQISIDAHGHGRDEHGHETPSLATENITLPSGGGAALSTGLLVLGLAGLGLTVAGAFVLEHGLRQALAAYHIGVMSVLAICLGSLFWVLVFRLTQAGWSTTLRRLCENVMALLPFAALLVLPTLIIELVNGGVLFAWMNPEIAGDDPLFTSKRAYFYFAGIMPGAPLFFILRAVVYIAAWTYLARRMYWYSVEQDRTGDKSLTNQAQRTAAWGTLVFALTTAFAAFDWLMTIDYRFFSTMWPVYYFAGTVFSSISMLALIAALVRRAGRLRGLVTEEHFHDVAKLMFGFLVFWAYIGFSQYFLIWYGNIPEETSYFLARTEGPWAPLSAFLLWGHFLVPFFILLWRNVRRSPTALALLAVWFLFMEVVDIYWIVRPMVFLPAVTEGVTDVVQVSRIWLDIAGIVGVLGLFGGLLVRKMYGGALVPLRDPRLPEALHHRNYV